MMKCPKCSEDTLFIPRGIHQDYIIRCSHCGAIFKEVKEAGE